MRMRTYLQERVGGDGVSVGGQGKHCPLLPTTLTAAALGRLLVRREGVGVTQLLKKNHILRYYFLIPNVDDNTSTISIFFPFFYFKIFGSDIRG